MQIFTKTPVLNSTKPIRLKDTDENEIFAPKNKLMDHNKPDTSFGSDESYEE